MEDLNKRRRRRVRKKKVRQKARERGEQQIERRYSDLLNSQERKTN